MASGVGRSSASFEAVLSSLRRDKTRAEVRTDGKPFPRPFFVADSDQTFGFAAAAESAFEDFPQPWTPPEPPTPLPSDAPDAIASELALADLPDPARLRSLRRRFMWTNHPDRRPDLPRELANRRVAIANMLIDRALRAIRPAGR